MSDSLRPHELQHARPPGPSPAHRVYSNSCPSSRWCHPAISSSVIPFSSCPQSLPASGSFLNSSHEVAKVLEFQLQHQSFQWTPRTDLLQDGLVGSPCSPRDSQESSPTPQFKSINFSALSALFQGWRFTSAAGNFSTWCHIANNVSSLNLIHFWSNYLLPSKCVIVIVCRLVYFHEDVNSLQEGELGTVYSLLSYTESCNNVLLDIFLLSVFTLGS